MGINYYRARYYNPTTGRFLSEDPLGFRAGPNFYAYAGDDPIDFKDPFGLDKNPPKKPQFCWGTFGFGGGEADFAEAGAFSGGIWETNSAYGMSGGALNEMWIGGEGPVAGIGKISSPTDTSPLQGWLGFVGGSISAGPLAGAQLGYAAGYGWGGLYLEGHIGTIAAGAGAYIGTDCSRENQ